MDDASPAQRARENATGIVSMLVTGIWLAALFLGFDWWLPFMLFGYIVLIPLTAILFGDEDDVEEWVGEDVDVGSTTDESADADDARTDHTHTDAADDEALARLRERYANGELTDEQFERKVERLLETDTLENVEDRQRDRDRSREREPEFE
ncbi:Short C-terminal domain-containing protein [Halomicrobium zhouii]|uniref:Short C-terminal domain-containing protein n=1 Tax=Halomicrobium zhouii TaxID=767519 RepID=A0A1I6L748_9EURY|nr:SHOCT domain-containing protein [Halomicrobium zhouii]SFR99333.1 Short C-terminal domain-containing protein [Halomicrobium zhouii]